MKFHVPFTSDASEQEQIYQGIRRSVVRYTGAQLTPHQIARLEYMDQGESVTLEVGQLHPLNGEMIMAIFYDETQDVFFICTPHQGALRNRPFTVAGPTVKVMREFSDRLLGDS